ncbi:uncharacterized protein LOC132624136 [Lycium barbarum]|uniref:uncharacterized protein LOC132624136 n=1 Tax=Lycium barbarum TaxID=112863 RepID=UPI00293E0C19|nr:uncharacterized protein LOC132624136 [Lycium barbarum]
MRWHSENRRTPGVLCHPSDGEAWKHFDRTYPDFASEPRNIHFGLCADGFTRHSVAAAPYSCWPVFLTPYNLPPEMCVVTYDVSTKSNFNMRASLMWTINDFPAYGMLSGWMTAGKLACPHCMENSKAFTLKHGHKNSWKMKQAFRKNKTENDPPPRTLSVEEIWGRVCHLPKVTEVAPYRLHGYGVEHNWTKQSIFWELPDVKGKTKDNPKARLDLKEYYKRPELNLQDRLPKRIWKPITEISLFFKYLCSNTLTVENLQRMEQNMPVITTKLEKIFPCGFFDVMEHLPIHLVQEARLGGPVKTRWMYPFERTIGKCKKLAKQRSKIERSICEAYLAKETTHFCSYYFGEQVSCMRNRPNHNDKGGVDPNYPPMSIFNQPGRGEHSQFVKDIALGPGNEVKTMKKCIINGYKFQTEEVSHYKKTNNSGVCIKGDADGSGVTVDYYGVLQEIIQLKYPGYPKKTITLFRCKWFDPCQRGKRVNRQHNVIEVKHTRQYNLYDPFIIAQNAKQVYYAPYPLHRDKVDWWVVIKTKPVGSIEVDNALDMAYKNDVPVVHQTVDTKL